MDQEQVGGWKLALGRDALICGRQLEGPRMQEHQYTPLVRIGAKENYADAKLKSRERSRREDVHGSVGDRLSSPTMTDNMMIPLVGRSSHLYVYFLFSCAPGPGAGSSRPGLGPTLMFCLPSLMI